MKVLSVFRWEIQLPLHKAVVCTIFSVATWCVSVFKCMLISTRCGVLGGGRSRLQPAVSCWDLQLVKRTLVCTKCSHEGLICTTQEHKITVKHLLLKQGKWYQVLKIRIYCVVKYPVLNKSGNLSAGYSSLRPSCGGNKYKLFVTFSMRINTI